MQLTIEEKLEEGICIRCNGDDVLCKKKCTLHICLDCGAYQERELKLYYNKTNTQGT